jgi:hypothetical protein
MLHDIAGQPCELQNFHYLWIPKIVFCDFKDATVNVASLL